MKVFRLHTQLWLPSQQIHHCNIEQTCDAILFTIGVFGIFLNRKNVIVILMSIELMLLAVNINLVAFSAFLVLMGIAFGSI